MATQFKCGSVAVPVGVTDFSVTDAALLFDPGVIHLSIRQPSADAPLVTAYVAGEPTRTGFAVTLSSPAESEGYLLEWSAFPDGVQPAVAGDTLSLDYNSLKEIVAHYLGWDVRELTEDQGSTVDMCIQSGLRKFYYPPLTDQMAPDFEWPFLRQVGTVSAVAGVASYRMPDGFGRIDGQITIGGEPGRNVIVIPYGDVAKMQTRGETGRPRFAAVIEEQAFGERGQMKRMLVYPTPDKAYDLNFVCDADTGKLDPEVRPFPLGGVKYAELLKEACLSAAEQDVNDTKEVHTENFSQLLAASIPRARRETAQVFGKVGDPNGVLDWGCRVPFNRHHR